MDYTGVHNILPVDTEWSICFFSFQRVGPRAAPRVARAPKQEAPERAAPAPAQDKQAMPEAVQSDVTKVDDGLVPPKPAASTETEVVSEGDSQSSSKLRGELVAARAEIDRLQQELSSVRQKSQAQIKEHLQTIHRLEKELESYKNARVGDGDASEAQREVAELKRTVASLRRQLDEKSQQLRSAVSVSPAPATADANGAAVEASRLVDELKGVIDRLELIDEPIPVCDGSDCRRFLVLTNRAFCRRRHHKVPPIREMYPSPCRFRSSSCRT